MTISNGRVGVRTNYLDRFVTDVPRGRRVRDGDGEGDAERRNPSSRRLAPARTGLLYLLFFLGFGAVGRAVLLPFRLFWRHLSTGVRLVVVESLVLVAYVAVVDGGPWALLARGLDGLLSRVTGSPDLLAVAVAVAVVVLAGSTDEGRRGRGPAR